MSRSSQGFLLLDAENNHEAQQANRTAHSRTEGNLSAHVTKACLPESTESLEVHIYGLQMISKQNAHGGATLEKSMKTNGLAHNIIENPALSLPYRSHALFFKGSAKNRVIPGPNEEFNCFHVSIIRHGFLQSIDCQDT